MAEGEAMDLHSFSLHIRDQYGFNASSLIVQSLFSVTFEPTINGLGCPLVLLDIEAETPQKTKPLLCRLT